MVAVLNMSMKPEKKVKKRQKQRILTGIQLKYNFSIQQLYCVKNNCTIRFSQISKYNTIYNFLQKIVLYCMLPSAALISMYEGVEASLLEAVNDAGEEVQDGNRAKFPAAVGFGDLDQACVLAPRGEFNSF